MTQPIDTAYVDIVARDKSLKNMRRDIDEALDKVDKDVTNHLRSIDDEFDDTFKKIDEHFEDVVKTTEKTFTQVERKIHESLKDVDVDVDRRSHRIRRTFSSLGAHVGDVFETIRRGLTKGLKGALDIFGDGVQRIGGALASIAGGIGGAAVSNPLIALILLLIPAIIALAAALSQLIGLVGILPASLGVLIAVIAPVVVAFQNFGEAVSALASGDIEKIDEALKKLSPSARVVAREIAAILPVLKSFQKAVQEAFFSQLRGAIPKFISTVLPAILENFSRIAAAVGGFGRKFLEFAGSLNAINAMNDLFDTTVNIVNRLSGPLIHLLDAIAISVSAGLPFVDRLATAFGKALDQFAAFISKSVETGAFNTFVEKAFTTVKELFALLKSVGNLIGVIFSGTEESGHDLLQTLTDVIDRTADFLKSPEGQKNIKAFVEAVKATGAVLSFLVDAGIAASKGVQKVIEVLKSIGSAFTTAVHSIGDFFAQIPKKFDEFKEFLKGVPKAIGDAIQGTIDGIFHAIGLQIGLILFAVQVLPGQIVDFFTSLPTRVSDTLADLGPKVVDIFHRMLVATKERVVNGFNEVVDFVKSIPDRLTELGPALLRAGKNLIESFMNGFRSVGSFIGDIAGDIVKAVRSFLNRAIDKINSGIAEVDAFLPGSLARIPHLAAGAIVPARPGGVLANISEGGEDEVVSPLSKLTAIIRDAIGRDNGMTINFDPGAINISFAGVVPTEGEARTVGRAVADSITAQLAKRNIRIQVRAA